MTTPLNSTVSQLVRRLHPVTRGKAGAALGVWGEVGVGKSHTLKRLLAELPCRSLSLPAAASSSAWASGLPQPRKLTSWASRTLTSLASGGTLDRADLLAALGAVLPQLTPFVLHLDDLHEADEARVGLISDLARAVQRMRGVGLVVTGRNEPPEPFLPLRLAPLSEAEARALLAAQAGSALPPEAAAWVFARAVGNPLYTLEFFRYLTRRANLWSDGQRWHWREPNDGSLPANVEALVAQRLAHAAGAPGARALLEAVAFLGDTSDPTLVAAALRTSQAEAASAMTTLRAAGIFAEDGFAHPLFREVALNQLSGARRRELARQAVDGLRQRPVVAARFVDDAELPSDQAREILVSAAAAASDAVVAASLRARASRFASGDDRDRLALDAAWVLQHHDLAESMRLVELALSGSFRAEALPMYAHLLARAGRQAEADELATMLPETLGRQVEPAALQITSRHVSGDHHSAWRIWLEHPELHANPAPALLRAAAASALASGKMAEAKPLIDQGLASVADPAVRSELLSLKSLVAFHSGDPRSAEQTIQEAIGLLEAIDAPRPRAAALLNRSAFLKMLGRYAEMGNCLEECLRIRRAIGDGKAHAFAQAALAELRVEQGRLDEAEDLLAEAVATLEQYGLSRFLVNARTVAAQLSHAQATPFGRVTALRHAEQALTEARQLGNPRLLREVLFDASFANSHSGDPARGLELALESEALAEAAGNSPTDEYRTAWAVGLALAARGEGAAATQRIAAALGVAEQVEGAVDAHKIALELARLKGDLALARANMAWFESRGLMNGVQIARRYFPVLSPPLRTVSEGSPRLAVMGPMQITVTTTAPVRGEKRRRLLALLLEARVSGRDGVGRSSLISELYPEQDEDQANSSLKELVRATRASLGAALVLTTPGGYALGDCVTDVERFLAEPDASLWRGLYLDGMEVGGAVQDSLYLALARHAQALLPHDPLEAARLGRILVEAEPYRTDYLAVCLAALRASGNYRSLNRQYQAARQQLVQVGEVLPERWQAFLADA